MHSNFYPWPPNICQCFLSGFRLPVSYKAVWGFASGLVTAQLGALLHSIPAQLPLCFPFIVWSWTSRGMENSIHLIQNVGVRWSVPHPMGLKVWRLERVAASSPLWGVAVCRSCLWGIWTFKTLSRVNLSSVVDWQSHVPSTHSVPWLFGVPEDCFLGRKNYKVGQSCWLCPSRLVGTTLWSLCQGSIWFGAVAGGISPERKCFLLWADGFTDY